MMKTVKKAFRRYRNLTLATRFRRRLHRPLFPLWLLMVGPLAVSQARAATLLGPPTYTTTNQVSIDRGSSTPLSFISQSSTGYNGSGSTGVSRIDAFISAGSLLPTEAFGLSSATQLNSLARATGELFGPTPDVPHITARNVSDVTRFWEFSSSLGVTTVDLDFFYFLDGQLLTAAFAEAPFAPARSKVRFALDVVTPAGGVVANIFQVTALNLRTEFGGYVLVTTASGAADLAAWQAAFTEVPPFPAGGGKAYGVNYFGRFANAYQAPVGVPVGLRWTLETEAHIEAAFAFNISLESNFRDSAEVGFEPTSGQTGVTFKEILSVPEPGAALFSTIIGGARHIVVDKFSTLDNGLEQKNSPS